MLIKLGCIALVPTCVIYEVLVEFAGVRCPHDGEIKGGAGVRREGDWQREARRHHRGATVAMNGFTAF